MLKRIHHFILTAVLIVLGTPLHGEPLHSPTWEFRMDLPEGYQLTGGDHKNQFSFETSFGAHFDLSVYTGKDSVKALAAELEKKLSNKGEIHFFEYNGKDAALGELRFANPQVRNQTFTGWILYLELEMEAQPGKDNSYITAPPGQGGSGKRPILAAMAYNASSVREDLTALHQSALDSICAGEGDRNMPGPVTDYNYPRGAWRQGTLAGYSIRPYYRENDAKAAQALVDREFTVLKRYLNSPLWQEAWKRFYRAIYRDSYDRLKGAGFLLERLLNTPSLDTAGSGMAGIESAKPGQAAPESQSAGKKPEPSPEGDNLGSRDEEALAFASKVLQWVQSFKYERDFMGSDFVNVVTAAQEGRGDCDSRALLWAIVLSQADIEAGIMVSREFSHAMGLADLKSQGAHFIIKEEGEPDRRWLVAETTAHVGIGLIGEKVSEISKWLGITF